MIRDYEHAAQMQERWERQREKLKKGIWTMTEDTQQMTVDANNFVTGWHTVTPTLQINTGTNGRPVLKFHQNGTIEIGEGYTPQDASDHLIDMVLRPAFAHLVQPRLADEIDRLRAELATANDERARLRDALSPFAKSGGLLINAGDGGDFWAYRPAGGDEYAITGTHLLAAHATFTEKNNG